MVLPHIFLLVNPLELGEYYELDAQLKKSPNQPFLLIMKKYPHRRITYSIGDINNFSAFIYATAPVIGTRFILLMESDGRNRVSRHQILYSLGVYIWCMDTKYTTCRLQPEEKCGKKWGRIITRRIFMLKWNKL